MGAIATPPAAKPQPPHTEWVVLVYNGDLLVGVHGVYETQEQAAKMGQTLTPRSEQHAVTYPLNLTIGSRDPNMPYLYDPYLSESQAIRAED